MSQKCGYSSTTASSSTATWPGATAKRFGRAGAGEISDGKGSHAGGAEAYGEFIVVGPAVLDGSYRKSDVVVLMADFPVMRALSMFIAVLVNSSGARFIDSSRLIGPLQIEK